MLRKICALFLTSIILCGCAASVSADSEVSVAVEQSGSANGDFTVSASFGGNCDYMTLTVFYPGKADVTDFDGAQDSIYTLCQFTGREFSYPITLSDDAQSGYYTASVGVLGVEADSSEKFFFANSQTKAAALAEFNSASKSQIADLIHKYATFDSGSDTCPVLNINPTDADKYVELISEAMVSGQSYSTLDDVSNRYNDTVIPHILNKAENAEDIKALINSYADILGLQSKDIMENIDDTSALILANKSEYPSAEAVKKDLNAYTALAIINKGTRQEIADTIEKYADSLGLDLNGYYQKADKIELTKALQNKNFANIEGMRVAFNNKLAAMEKEAQQSSVIRPGGGGGGGGSSAGTRSGASSIIQVPVSESKDTVSFTVAEPFTDTDTVPWAAEAIEVLRKRGIVNGTEGKFMPSENVTREQYVKMIILALGIEPDANTFAHYTDADVNEWYYPYISTATRMGICNGYDNGKFGIGDFVTRQDIAVMTVRAARAAGREFTASDANRKFKDEADIAEYAIEAVNILYSAGIVNGKYENAFAPKETASRAETAKILYGILLM